MLSRLLTDDFRVAFVWLRFWNILDTPNPAL